MRNKVTLDVYVNNYVYRIYVLWLYGSALSTIEFLDLVMQ